MIVTLTLVGVAIVAHRITRPTEHTSPKEVEAKRLFDEDYSRLFRAIEKCDPRVIDLYDRLIDDLQRDHHGKIAHNSLQRAAGSLREQLYNRCPATLQELHNN